MNSIGGHFDQVSKLTDSSDEDAGLWDMFDNFEAQIGEKIADEVDKNSRDCKPLVAFIDSFNEPQVVDIRSFVEQNKSELGKNPSEIMDGIKEKIANGDAHIALMHKKPGEEKPEFFFDAKFKEQIQGKDLHVRMRDRTSGKTVSSVLRPDDYTVRTFSDEQYARITGAAIKSLNSLAEAYRQHQEKLAKAEETGEPLLKGRVDIRSDIPSQFVKDAMKNLTAQNQAYQRRKEQRMDEIKQEELDREEKAVNERTIAQLDKKYEIRKEMERRDDQLKSQEKGAA